MMTITFSRIGSLDIKLDLYLPSTQHKGALPALVVYHGGGTVAGNRKDFGYPQSMETSALEKGIVFISADYRLIHSSTGFDIIEDVKTLFTFIASSHFSITHLPHSITIDSARIAVAGVSGGAYPACAAGLYAHPKPKAVCIHYGMSGQLLDDHWLDIKTSPRNFPGEDFITDELMAPLFEKPLSPVSDIPISMSEDGMFLTEDNRVGLLTLFWKKGNYLDYLLGEPGISAHLRTLPSSERADAIPEHLRRAVVQTQFKDDFPPTILIHGDQDTLIKLTESQTTYERLKELGVKVELIVVEGAGHVLMDPLNFPNQVVGAAEVEEKAMAFVAEELFRK